MSRNYGDGLPEGIRRVQKGDYQITEIIVSSGRTLPHPSFGYSSLKVDLSIRATVSNSESLEELIHDMQKYVDAQTKKHIIALRDEEDVKRQMMGKDG